MNAFNKKRLALYGAKIQPVDDHVSILLPTGRAIGFARDPHPFENDKFSEETKGLIDPYQKEFVENDIACAYAGRTWIAVSRLAKAVADAANDNRLTSAGRIEKLAAPSAAAVAAIATQYANISQQQRVVATMDADVFDKPLNVAASDFKIIMADHEIRTAYRAANDGERLAMINRFTNNEAFIAALRRSPLPLSDRDDSLTLTAWRGIVTAKDPERAAAVKVATENCEWAHHVITNSAKVIADLTQFTRLDLYRHSRETGGADVFDIAPADRVAFDHRIAHQQQKAA